MTSGMSSNPIYAIIPYFKQQLGNKLLLLRLLGLKYHFVSIFKLVLYFLFNVFTEMYKEVFMKCLSLRSHPYSQNGY